VSGIFDTRDGGCAARLNVRGEDFKCELASSHQGWAHQSRSAEAIWTGK
jgi:hypothetical protein